MKRQSYTKSFKVQAVKLLEKGDKSPTVLARDLGVRRNQLYKWQRQLAIKGESAFPGAGRHSKDQLSDVAALQRRVAELEEENEILKKAEAYFTDNQQ